jgi:hypothetical protein
MSRIAALAAIVLAATACQLGGEPDDAYCGDDEGHVEGLIISVANQDPEAAYGFVVETDDVVLELGQFGRDPAVTEQRVELDDGTMHGWLTGDLVITRRDLDGNIVGPDHVRLTVLEDDREVLSVSFFPAYLEDFDDGEDCPPYISSTMAIELPRLTQRRRERRKR